MSSTDQGSEKDVEKKQSASQESTEETKQTSETDTDSADSQSSTDTASGESTVKKDDKKGGEKINKAWFAVHREKNEAEKKAREMEEKARKLERKEEVRKLIASNPQILVTYDQNPTHPDTQVANELLSEGDYYAIAAYNSLPYFTNKLPMQTTQAASKEEPKGDYVTKEDLMKREKQKEFDQIVDTIRAEYPELNNQSEEEIILSIGGEKAVEFMTAKGFKTAFKAAVQEKFGNVRKKKEDTEKEMDNQQHQTTSVGEQAKAVRIPSEYKQAYADTIEAFKAHGDTPPSEEEWMKAHGLL